MTRIVAGVARGRILVVPSGGKTRPTSDRAREAMFSTLDGLTTLSGAAVLDLYAGSGALGLEALSRGATHALLVERDRRAADTLRSNIATLGLSGAVALTSDVARVAATDPTDIGDAVPPYDLVVADPPYELSTDQFGDVLTDLHRHGWLAAGAVLVVERSSRDERWVWPHPLEGIRDRRYGEAVLWYGRAP